jgi:hypothetical protein
METATPDGALTHINYDINTLFIGSDTHTLSCFFEVPGRFLQKWDKHKVHRWISKPNTSKSLLQLYMISNDLSILYCVILHFFNRSHNDCVLRSTFQESKCPYWFSYLLLRLSILVRLSCCTQPGISSTVSVLWRLLPVHYRSAGGDTWKHKVTCIYSVSQKCIHTLDAHNWHVDIDRVLVFCT